MNILILTPIHPMQIAEMIDFLVPYNIDGNELFSVQSMALLAEETLNKNYIPTTFTYATEIRKHPKLAFKSKSNSTIRIYYGNLDKNTNIKFDHILAYTNHYSETEDNHNFDIYLENAATLMNPTFNKMNIKPIEWYTIDDAEHIFPSLHHLATMLEALGVNKVVKE